METLKDKGPLNYSALHHFASERYGRNILDIDFQDAYHLLIISKTILNKQFNGPIFLGIDPTAPIVTPSPQNYKDAYYDLWGKYKKLLTLSGFEGTPEEWLEELT